MFSFTAICVCAALAVAPAEDVFPGATWQTRTPPEVGLDPAKLAELARLVGGRGCVVRHGYLVYSWGDVAKQGDIASAVKPVISTLLLMAIEEGRLKSVDQRVADVLPELARLDGGKNANITWRHFASQTSGYGLSEAPGQAYSYNDFALALYYDTLMGQVFADNGTNVFRTRLAEPLEFEDRYSFEGSRPGRLSVSVRDLARFGLLYLKQGRWRDRQIVKPEHIALALSQPVPADLPLTSGVEAAMLPDQRSLGGSRNITPAGPGFYSFNWWLNGQDRAGRRLFVDAPHDSYVAAGNGGRRMLWVLPSLDLIVAWNDSAISDHDASPGNAATRANQAARLMRTAVVAAGR